MTGLEVILEQIKKESTQKIDVILHEAGIKRDEIVAKADAQAVEAVSRAELEAGRSAKDLLSRSRSAAELTARQNELKKKQQIIDIVIDQAYRQLLELSDDDYYELILKMLKRYADESQEGEIIFSEQDRKRLSLKFKMAMSMLSRGLKLSEETRNIDGGFILVYGDIEENCTFHAIFEEARDRMKDQISDILFG